MATRRHVLHLLWGAICVLSLLGAGFIAARAGQSTAEAAPANAITDENALEGNDTWNLDNPANDVDGQIKGYADKASVAPGQSIEFKVSVKDDEEFRIEVFRMGYYGGDGARLMTTIGPLEGVEQPGPVLGEDYDTYGLIEVDWATSHTLTIPNDWVSGVYLAKLTRTVDEVDNHIVFVVADGRSADVLFQVPTSTYQANNNWPNDGLTGKSLYASNSFGPDTALGRVQAHRVSFNRPYADGGAGDLLKWDLSAIVWLEREGYDISYTTSHLVHANGIDASKYEVFVSPGLDHHWSKASYDAAEAAVAAGLDFAFMGGNPIHWEMAWADNGRTINARKIAGFDRWRDAPNGRPEQELVGIQWNQNAGCCTPLVVRNAGHWVWDDTGFANGDTVPNLVGDHVDNLDTAFVSPESVSYTRLARSPYPDPDSETFQETSIRQAESGAWIFAAGTNAWAWALTYDDWQSPIDRTNPGIQQAMKNVMDVMVGDADVPPDPTPTPTTTPTPDPGPVPTCLGVEATIVGNREGNAINGTAADDVIVGLGGNDVIDGRGGADLICGGRGNDTIRGGAGADQMRGNAGSDAIFGGAGPDEISGGPGTNDTCAGGKGRDRNTGGCETVVSIP